MLLLLNCNSIYLDAISLSIILLENTFFQFMSYLFIFLMVHLKYKYFLFLLSLAHHLNIL